MTSITTSYWITAGQNARNLLTYNSTNSKLYMLNRDKNSGDTIRILSSSSPFTSWSTEDTSVSTTANYYITGAIGPNGNYHIILTRRVVDKDYTFYYEYVEYDMSTDTFGSIGSITNITKSGNSVFTPWVYVRSDGDIVVFFEGAPDSDMGSEVDRSYYVIKPSGGSWGTPVKLTPPNSTSADHTVNSVHIIDTNDSIWLQTSNSGTQDHVLTSADSFSNETNTSSELWPSVSLVGDKAAGHYWTDGSSNYRGVFIGNSGNAYPPTTSFVIDTYEITDSSGDYYINRTSSSSLASTEWYMTGNTANINFFAIDEATDDLYYIYYVDINDDGATSGWQWRYYVNDGTGWSGPTNLSSVDTTQESYGRGPACFFQDSGTSYLATWSTNYGLNTSFDDLALVFQLSVSGQTVEANVLSSAESVLTPADVEIVGFVEGPTLLSVPETVYAPSLADDYYSGTVLATNNLAGYFRFGEASGTVAYDISETGNNGEYKNTPTLGTTGLIANDPDTAVTLTAAQSEHVLIPHDASYNSSEISVELWIKNSISTTDGSRYELASRAGYGIAGNVIDSITAPGNANPVEVTYDGVYLWTCDQSTLYQIDPETASINNSFAVPGSITTVTDIAYGNGYLWILQNLNNDERVFQVDPSTEAVVNSWLTPGATGDDRSPDCLTWYDDGVNTYVVVGDTFDVYFLDPSDGTQIDSFNLSPSPAVNGIAWDGSFLIIVGGWDAGTYQHDMYRYAPSGTQVANWKTEGSSADDFGHSISYQAKTGNTPNNIRRGLTANNKVNKHADTAKNWSVYIIDQDVYLSIWESNTEYTISTSGIDVTDGEKHYIAATSDTTNGYFLYVDGNLEASHTTTPRSVDQNTNSISIGAWFGEYDTGSNFYDGVADEFSFCTSALSSTAISDRYILGAGRVKTQTLSSPESLLEPSVATGAVSLTTNALDQPETLLNPSVAIVQTVETNVLSSVESVLTPADVIPGAVSLVTNLLTSTESLFNPSTTTSTSVTANVLTQSESLLEPSVSTGVVSLTTNLLTQAESLLTPSVSPGVVSLVVEVLTQPEALNSPTVDIGQTVEANVFDSPESVLTPTVFAQQTIDFNTLSAPEALLQPTVFFDQFADAQLLSVTPTLLQPDLFMYLVPDVDPTVTGSWTNESWATTNLYQSIDEQPSAVNDSDFVRSPASPVSDSASFPLQSLNDPGVDTGHTVQYRLKKDYSSGDALSVTVILKDSGGTVASWNHNPLPDTWTDYEQTLTELQASNITDYDSLEIEFDVSVV